MASSSNPSSGDNEYLNEYKKERISINNSKIIFLSSPNANEKERNSSRKAKDDSNSMACLMEGCMRRSEELEICFQSMEKSVSQIESRSEFKPTRNVQVQTYSSFNESASIFKNPNISNNLQTQSEIKKLCNKNMQTEYLLEKGKINSKNSNPFLEIKSLKNANNAERDKTIIMDNFTNEEDDHLKVRDKNRKGKSLKKMFTNCFSNHQHSIKDVQNVQSKNCINENEEENESKIQPTLIIDERSKTKEELKQFLKMGTSATETDLISHFHPVQNKGRLLKSNLTKQRKQIEIQCNENERDKSSDINSKSVKIDNCQDLIQDKDEHMANYGNAIRTIVEKRAISSSDIPIEIWFNELAHARIQDNSQVVSLFTGELGLSFPSSLIPFLKSVINLPQLSFSVKMAKWVIMKDHFLINKFFTRSFENNITNFQFNMPNLMREMMNLYEKNPNEPQIKLLLAHYWETPHYDLVFMPLRINGCWSWSKSKNKEKYEILLQIELEFIPKVDEKNERNGNENEAPLFFYNSLQNITVSARIEGKLKTKSRSDTEIGLKDGKIIWKIPKMNETNKKVSLEASFELDNQGEIIPLDQPRNLEIHFNCENGSFSGSEISILPLGYRLANFTKTIASGTYVFVGERVIQKSEKTPVEVLNSNFIRTSYI